MAEDTPVETDIAAKLADFRRKHALLTKKLAAEPNKPGGPKEVLARIAAKIDRVERAASGARKTRPGAAPDLAAIERRIQAVLARIDALESGSQAA